MCRRCFSGSLRTLKTACSARETSKICVGVLLKRVLTLTSGTAGCSFCTHNVYVYICHVCKCDALSPLVSRVTGAAVQLACEMRSAGRHTRATTSDLSFSRLELLESLWDSGGPQYTEVHATSRLFVIFRTAFWKSHFISFARFVLPASAVPVGWSLHDGCGCETVRSVPPQSVREAHAQGNKSVT